MPTSGSVDFSVTRNNLITDALIECGAIGPGDTPSTAQIEHAARRLNAMVKAWQSWGPSLWARKIGYILPQTTSADILLGPTGGHATLSFVQTKLAANANSGASTITVDSTNGIGTNYYVGVELNDKTVHWTTVSAVSGTNLTLAVSLPSATSVGNFVWAYQTKLQRPLRILDALYRENDVDRKISIVSKAHYLGISDKTVANAPLMLVYDPQLNNGICSIYPKFGHGRGLIVISFQRPFEDFDAANDEPDFPQEWYDALCLNLAERLMGAYGLPTADRIELSKRAREALQLVANNEPEEGSLFIQPNL